MRHPVPVRRTALLTALALACGPVAPITTYTSPAAVIQGQAAGKPIFDCSGLQTTAARMRAGLPAQDEAIRRTQEQLDAARNGLKQSVQEAQMLALKEAAGAAVHQLDYVREAKAGIAKSAASNADRLKWNNYVDKVKAAAEALQNLTSSGASGVNIGAAIRQNQLTLETFAKELEGSGISDELGKAAATAIAGPAGGLAVEIGISARDAIAAGWDLYNNASEADAAQRNLDAMRQARSAIDSRLYEINSTLTTECAPPAAPPQDRIMTQPPAADPPPYTPVPPAKPAPAQAPAKGHGSGGALLTLLVVGAGGAAVYGYAKNKYGTTCTAPTADIISICSSQGGGSSACKTALANQDSYCKCEGYAGFNAGSGRCQ